MMRGMKQIRRQMCGARALLVALDGQHELKRRSRALVAGRPQAPAVPLDDGPADRKPQYETVGLRRVKCGEAPVEVLGSPAAPRILDRDQDARTLVNLAVLRSNRERAVPSLDVRHRLYAVHDQVEQHLLVV